MTIYYCARFIAFCLMLIIIGLSAYLFLIARKALTGEPGTNGSEIMAYAFGSFFGMVFYTISSAWIEKKLKGV